MTPSDRAHRETKKNSIFNFFKLTFHGKQFPNIYITKTAKLSDLTLKLVKV